MSVSLRAVLRKLPAAQRKQVEARAAVLVAEEMSLAELRKAHARTQVSVARKLGIGQDAVSRVEARSDLLISTLRHYVGALGGEIDIVVRFKDRPPVILAQSLGDLGAARSRR